jgi:hypothetical protein
MEPSAARWVIGIVWGGIACAGIGTGLGAGIWSGRETSEPVAVVADPSNGAIRYDRDIRPLLSDRCFKCHGPDPASRKGKLRLDVSDAATDPDRDAVAIVPGDPDASEVWARLTSDDPEEQMPPPASGKKPLTDQERELIRRWIAQGAVYEPHWSFVPPVRPPIPEVRDTGWCRGPIDRFVLARLESEGIAPAPEADPETLVRRVFLDLTGLPPTIEELDAYLADPSPDRYPSLVDRLLTQEPYRTRTAERLATPWLDAARYADTCGIHTDNGRQIWSWRDWVLGALRDNMPYDRFIVEQLAGDLLPDATQAQRIASGFNRNHVTTDEGGAIADEYLVEYAVDRAVTTSTVFLGLTMGCARCHDHKFDPISQEEFFSFLAFFNSIEEPGLYTQTPDANRAHEPFMEVLTDEQRATLEALGAERESVRLAMAAAAPEESAAFGAFLESAPARAGVSWSRTSVVSASSTGGATLTAQADGSVLASGENPATDVHEIVVRGGDKGTNLVLLEALADPSLGQGRLGRSPNGNAVMTGIEVESVAPDGAATTHRIRWLWADVSQNNGDYRFTNLLTPGGGMDRGWAVDAHRSGGDRRLMVMVDPPAPAGRDVRVRLRYEAVHARHVLGRVRLTLGAIADPSGLPTVMSNFWLVGPFPNGGAGSPYETMVGPESVETIDFARNFGSGNQFWRYDANLRDSTLVPLAEGNNVTFLGRLIASPVDRQMTVSLSSDDGFVLYVNGKEVSRREVERGLMADQDAATIPLRAGVNVVVLKIINTGGGSGYFFRPTGEDSGATRHDLAAAILPEAARAGDVAERLKRAWRVEHSPRYREHAAQIEGIEKSISAIHAAAPKTMIMKELETPRETFVLQRGQYDKPDRSRRVSRGVPAALGKLGSDLPQNRLGLARWLVSAENPLTARLTVNRLWEMIFGAGIERTSEDFGLQGEWPTHPELLEFLATEFRDSGWDLRRMLREIVTSATYRQSSAPRPELKERDPDNRLLARYARRRQTAEQIRDHALYTSGLLVEKLGGPSVKTSQPEGLWREGALPASNTQVYERGKGEDLYRRTLYSYWKRAVPPPNLQAFDAPTREYCVVKRPVTGTPLQALVLWNDPQFVEAARALALRTLREGGDERQMLGLMYRRCTGVRADEAALAILERTLAGFRERYRNDVAAAESLIKVGEMPTPDGMDRAELAAWSMTASAVMNLYRATTVE